MPSTAELPRSYSFTSQNVTYLLNILSVLMEVTGMNPNSYQALEWLSQAEGQKWPASSWRIFSQRNPSGPVECLQNISPELNFFNSGDHLKTVVSTEI